VVVGGMPTFPVEPRSWFVSAVEVIAVLKAKTLQKFGLCNICSVGLWYRQQLDYDNAIYIY